MALALTYKTKERVIEKCAKDFKILIGALTLTGTYVTNGEAMDISDYFPSELQLVLVESKGGFVFEYDYTAKKVKAYYYDYDAVADGAAIEVANTADITAANGAKFIAIGY